MTNASLSLLDIEVTRFYAGSTNVDSKLTFNTNSQSAVSFDSVKSVITNNAALAQTQFGFVLDSVTQESQNNTTSNPNPNFNSTTFTSTTRSATTSLSTPESFSCNFPLSSIDTSKFKLH